MPCIATGATGPSRTPPTHGAWAAGATGRPRRRSPTWTATATSTSTSATTRPGTSTNPRICRDPKTQAYLNCNPLDCRGPARPPLPQRRRPVRGCHRRGRGSSTATAAAWAWSPPTSTTDGRIDLFVANDSSANFLFRNLGGMRFEEVGHAAGVAGNASGAYQAGMGVAAGDLDGDGLIDLAVTNFYGESTTFYRNLGGGVFADATAASRPGRRQPSSARLRRRLPRRQQRRPARPGLGQRPRQRPPAQLSRT